MSTEEIKISCRGVFVKNDQVVLPRKLTDEALERISIGEFYEEREVVCPQCGADFDSECLMCNGKGLVPDMVQISGESIKTIYEKIVKEFGG